MEEEKGRPETGGLKADGSETADGEAAAATNPLSSQALNPRAAGVVWEQLGLRRLAMNFGRQVRGQKATDGRG